MSRVGGTLKRRAWWLLVLVTDHRQALGASCRYPGTKQSIARDQPSIILHQFNLFFLVLPERMQFNCAFGGMTTKTNGY